MLGNIESHNFQNCPEFILFSGDGGSIVSGLRKKILNKKSTAKEKWVAGEVYPYEQSHCTPWDRVIIVTAFQ